MLVEFAKHILAHNGKVFNLKQHRIRCLAHIINLATQALITTYSKSKHYNPADPDADLAGPERDEVGLVQAICVKARSSAKRKQLFTDIQTRGSAKTIHQLLLDMAEKDLSKRKKIDDLWLSDAEWEQIGLFNDLLAVRHCIFRLSVTR
ncbi:hypothetical protein L208DRAFT_1544821 [Tricholoma matsutake]|nr:hypothetical protein L208DRAFT_1544821 [Tricholoma matsutake 945]